jgi:hypothetical protein
MEYSLLFSKNNLQSAHCSNISSTGRFFLHQAHIGTLFITSSIDLISSTSFEPTSSPHFECEGTQIDLKRLHVSCFQE